MTGADSPSRWVTVLSGDGGGASVLGGKAAAMDRMVALGMPVPPCGAITSAAYREFVEGSSLRGLIGELVSGALPPPEMHAAERARVDEAFLSVDLPPPMKAEIESLASEIAPGANLAVRSSATAEDLSEASFAGQYRSFLDVSHDDLADAVRLTWASLWHPAPRVYRRFRSIPEGDLAMAVLVMPMLAPSHAGVLFTVDPGGRADCLRVETVSGLGEQLVSGAVTPDVLVVPRDRAPEELGDLSPEMGELARLTLALEAPLGGPQDVEWAIAEGRLNLLQARPITGIGAHDRPADPFDDDPHPDTTYTTSGIREMLPGVLAPRLWELNRLAVNEAFGRLFARLGGSISTEDHGPLLARFRGRAALNMDRMRASVASIPGGSAAELERQYTGRSVQAASEPSGGSRRGRAAQMIRTARERLAAAEEAEVVVEVATLLAEREPDLGSFDNRSLLAYRSRVADLTVRAMAAEVEVAAMAVAAHKSVETILGRKVGDRGVGLAGRATRITEKVGVSAAMADLADAHFGGSAVSAAAGCEWDVARAELERTEGGRRFLAEMSDSLRRVGCRSVPGGETWDEAEESAWALFSSEALSGDAEEPQEVVELPKGRLLRREVSVAVDLLTRREQAKAALMAIGALVQRADREVGRRAVSVGALEVEDDVDLLLSREFGLLLTGAGPSPAEIANRRRRLDGQLLDGSLPPVFRGAPTSARRPPVVGERILGWGASPGRFEGPTRVVTSSAGSGLSRGEVLVARTTDASWAPLFLLAGAVVVEEGGPLSHAAIVTRELGVPAVLNVPGIVDRLEREVGEVSATVDGTVGEVILHRSGPRLDRPRRGQVPIGGRGEPVLGAGVAPADEPPDGDGEVLGRFGVFVTGLIGTGTLLSVVFRLSQSLSGSRTRARLEARAHRRAELVAESVVSGSRSVAASPLGLRSRRFHWTWAAILGLLGAGLVGLMIVNDSSGGWAPLWRGAGSAAAAEVLAIAAIVGVAAWRWPSVPLVARRLMPAESGVGRRWKHVVGSRSAVAVSVCIGFVTLVALMLTFAEEPLQKVDNRLYEAMGAGPDIDKWGPEWLEVVGTSKVMIPVALVVALSVVRCRPLAWSIPAIIAVAGATHLTLGHFISRDRPPLSTRAGDVESFPGGFVLEVTLVLGFLPLAVAVLTRRRWAVRVAWIVAVVAYALVVPDAVREGSHWPTDNLSGLALGVAFALVAHGVARAPELHESCRDCPVRRARSEEQDSPLAAS